MPLSLINRLPRPVGNAPADQIAAFASPKNSSKAIRTTMAVASHTFVDEIGVRPLACYAARGGVGLV